MKFTRPWASIALAVLALLAHADRETVTGMVQHPTGAVQRHFA